MNFFAAAMSTALARNWRGGKEIEQKTVATGNAVNMDRLVCAQTLNAGFAHSAGIP
jgi:hypothetical protein